MPLDWFEFQWGKRYKICRTEGNDERVQPEISYANIYEGEETLEPGTSHTKIRIKNNFISSIFYPKILKCLWRKRKNNKLLKFVLSNYTCVEIM